jgi:hypothetical protein
MQFNIPLYVNSFSEGARRILSENNLAAEVSKAFGHVGLPHSNVNAKFLTSRKDIRNTYKVAKKKGFEKTFKVIFVKDIPLPSHWTKSLQILEGMFTLNSYENETMIKENLAALVQHSMGGSCMPEKLVFLSYSGKMLNLPCVPLGFKWSGECLKANIGQGKLYVMIKEDKEQVCI